MTQGNIAILATLDTKGEEVASMKKRLHTLGYGATLIDIGPLGPPLVSPDVTNDEVARQGGWELSSLIKIGERDRVMEVMGKGAMKLLSLLFVQGKIDGVIGIGGNQGTAVSSMAMRALPFGFPKYLVSTVASGNIRPYIGNRDIGVIFSVADFLGGSNPVTTSILANAVAAVVGMAEHGARINGKPGQRTIAITTLGNTETAATRGIKTLRERGFQAIPFHASGAGGSAMEDLIEEGLIHGVLDLTPHELTEEVVGAGAYQPIEPGRRLKTAGLRGIPQVLATGGMEYLCFGPRTSIPVKMRNRKTYMHNPLNANVKASRGEMANVGRVMAERLNESKGPTAVLIPMRGWSIYGAPGGPLHDEGGYRFFLRALADHLKSGILMKKIDAHINDPLFIDACVNQLDMFMEKSKEQEIS
jgi:uncharacterized protein (UPF0261 family)